MRFVHININANADRFRCTNCFWHSDTRFTAYKRFSSVLLFFRRTKRAKMKTTKAQKKSLNTFRGIGQGHKTTLTLIKKTKMKWKLLGARSTPTNVQCAAHTHTEKKLIKFYYSERCRHRRAKKIRSSRKGKRRRKNVFVCLRPTKWKAKSKPAIANERRREKNIRKSWKKPPKTSTKIIIETKRLSMLAVWGQLCVWVQWGSTIVCLECFGVVSWYLR